MSCQTHTELKSQSRRDHGRREHDDEFMMIVTMIMVHEFELSVARCSLLVRSLKWHSNQNYGVQDEK